MNSFSADFLRNAKIPVGSSQMSTFMKNADNTRALEYDDWRKKSNQVSQISAFLNTQTMTKTG